ncbi:tandem-95 repeat protein [Novipirellula rosea]|uniref:Matrixin n=1 Tax=Novipirellula rosea TaxID=1031540 RepID=A0ABP8MFY2_9BACT
MLTQQLEDRRLLAGPELIAIRPDAGALLQSGDTLNVAPREFNLLFKGGADLNESTINANTVRLVRSGGDGTFGDGNEQRIALGYVGLDEPGSTDPEELQRIVFRTASSASHNPTDDLSDPAAVLNSFPDDTYRIEIIGAGAAVLENNAGEAFNSGVNYALPFRLDRGAQVVAVVPQPIERLTNGDLSQKKDTIVVHFDGQALDSDDANDPKFFRLVDTAGSLSTADDVTLVPATAAYDNAASTVTLTFDSDIPEGTYRLDVGYSADGTTANGGAIHVGSLFANSGTIQSGYTKDGFLGDANGLNNDANDVDRYRVQIDATGQLTINASPHAGMALTVRVLSADLTTVVAAATTGAVGAVVNSMPILAAGEYVVEISSASGTGSYGLEIQSNISAVVSDDNSSVNNATKLGVLGAAGVKVASTISAQNVPLPPYPGSQDEPGHRQIQREQHIGASGTALSTPQPITVFRYNFPANIGTDSNGVSYPNEITAREREIVRGIFDVLASQSGYEFIEVDSSAPNAGLRVGKGDLRAVASHLSPTSTVAGIFTGGAVTVNKFEFPALSTYGDGFTETMTHELLHALGLGHAYELPATMSKIAVPGQVLPGDNDIVHLQRIVPPNSTDIDLYQFQLKDAGKFKAEAIAERLSNPSMLDSVLTLYRQTTGGKVELVVQNDHYFGHDAFLEVDLQPGIYFVGVSSTGNDDYDPRVPDSGSGGTTDGAYELKLSFEANRGDAALRDSDGTLIDGDGDGTPGGVHSFWFQSASPGTTIFVDRANDTNLSAPDGNGSLLDPFDTISSAVTAAATRIVVPKNALADISTGDIITIDDGINPELTLTFGTVGLDRIDISAATTPEDVAATIAAAINSAKSGGRLSAGVTVSQNGRIVQLANIDTLDVENTPALLAAPNLIRIVGNGGLDGNLSTFNDNTPYLIGENNSGVALRDGLDLMVPQGATLMIDAGALIKLRKANIDIGTSSIGISRAGSAIQVLGTPVNPVYMRSYHNDAFGGDSDGIGTPASGDFGGIVIRDDSDLEDRGIFLSYVNHADINNGGGKVAVNSQSLTFTSIHIVDARPTLSFNHISNSQNAAISASPDSFDDSLDRIGPDIYGNFLADNRIDGLFVRVEIASGSVIDRLDVPGRFDDVDIPHVLTQSLIIAGNPGGPFINAVGARDARAAGRLMIDPGVVVKLSNARIEAERGASALIAEGTENRPVIFTSLFDDRYGGSGTFDTDGNPSTVGAPGNWSGLFFGEVSFGSIDHALISFAGGDSPIEGVSANFNAIEVHQADLRLTNSVLKDNAGGGASGNRSGRGQNANAVIYVRGSQPTIVDNTIVDNSGAAIHINANSLNSENRIDHGRSTAAADRYSEFDDNFGPLVRLNRLDNNSTNGMFVRGEILTTEGIWDDTDIVHVLNSTITVDNHHHVSGLRLQSSNSESLVIKLFGPSAGFTATGTPLEMIDRIGGSIHVLGTPGHPVVMTSLRDDSVGAGFGTDGSVMTNTNNTLSPSTGSPGDWRGMVFDEWSNDRNVAIIRERENPLTAGNGINENRPSAQFLGNLAPDEKSGDENRRLGFEVQGYISPDDPTDVDVYSFSGVAGTDVWIDVDRTDSALDAVVEIVNANGTVLARSVRSSNPAFAGNLNSATLTQNPNLGGDFYSHNFRDPGLYFRLPGVPGSEGVFFVRVRSLPGSNPIATLAGESSGQYQLQIRTQQEDEFPGSTVQYSDIRFASTAIDVRGLPAHSPLIAEAGELGVDNNDFAEAQTLVNLLETDMAAIGLSGVLSDNNDIDWYRFKLNHVGVQTISGVNDGPGTVSVVLDMDYADKAVRADTTVAVYNNAGRLVYVSRESNVDSDQPVGSDPSVDDLSRGSLGDKDPFIGPFHLSPVAANQYFYVAVMSNRQLPTALMGAFQADPSQANQLMRLEPVNSVTRIVEDHIGISGYRSQGVGVVPTEADGIFNVTDEVSLASHVIPFDLSDVVTYVSTDSGFDAVDDNLYTASILKTQDFLTRLKQNVGSGRDDLQDIVIRSDGAMYGYIRLENGVGTVGQLVKIDPTDGSFISVQNDNIPGNGTTPNTNIYTNANPAVSDQLDQFTISHDVDAFTFERTGTTGPSSAPVPTYNVYYSVRESDGTSKLYRARENGDASPRNAAGGQPRYGYLGHIQSTNVVNASETFLVRDSANPVNSTTIEFRSKLPGDRGNDVSVVVSYEQVNSGAGATVTSASNSAATNPVVNLRIRYTRDNNGAINGGPTAGDIADVINNHVNARELITAVITSGNTGTNGRNFLANGTVVTIPLVGGDDGAIGPVTGRVTGLSFDNFLSNGNLFGVTNAGEFLEINPDNGLVINRREVFNSAGNPFSFQGLALGPQNVNDGAYANTLFAVTSSGEVVALDSSGNPVYAFESDNGTQLVTVGGAPSGDSFFTLTFDNGVTRQTTEPIKADAPYTASVNEEQTISTDAYSGNFTLSFEKDQGAVSALLQPILTAPVAGTSQTIQVQNVSDQPFTEQWPATPFVIQIQNEQMLVTSRVGNSFTVTRGIHNTTPTTHPDTATVAEVTTSLLTTAMSATASSALTVTDLLSASSNLTFSSPLALDISPTALFLEVDDASVFPAAPFPIRVGGEDMLVSAVDLVNNEFMISRAENGTTAATHLAGSQVQVIPVAGAPVVGLDNNPASTTLRVVDASIYPNTNFSILIGGEELEVTGVDLVTNELTVIRAQNGTTIANHNIGTQVRVLPDAISTTGASITASATTIEVIDADIFPTSLPFKIQIENEELLVTNVNATLNRLTVTRAQNGTVAVAHDLGSPVRVIPVFGTGFVGIDNLSTTLSVVDASEFPPAPFSIRIDDEVMFVTAVDLVVDQLTVSRAELGTSATSHQIGSLVEVLTPSSSALTAPIAASPLATSLQVFDGSVFPATPFTIRVDREEMLVTNVNTGTNTLTVVRGRNGTAIDIHYDPQVATVVSDTLTVETDAPFPTTGSFNIRIGNEDLRVVSRTGNQFNVIRAINGTERVPHNADEVVRYIETTAPIAYNATAAQVAAALGGLPSIASGDITVSIYDGPLTGDTSGTVTIEFSNNLGKKDLLELTSDTSGLMKNEVQSVTLDSLIVGGTFQLEYDGENTGDLDFNATPAVIQAELELLPNIGPGNVVVTGGPLPGSPIQIEFTNTLGNQNILPQITVVNDNLVNNERQQLSISGGPTGGTFTLDVPGYGTTSNIAWNANAAAVRTALEGIGSIGVGNVTVTGGGNLPGATFTIEFNGALEDTNIGNITSGTAFTGGTNPNVVITQIINGNSIQASTDTVINGGPVSVSHVTDVDGVLSVRDAIVGLSTIGDNDVLVSGDLQGAGVVVQFTNALGGADQILMEVDNFQMSGGTANVTVDGIKGDGVPDDFVSRVTAMAGTPTGIAFSPLDFNLWHPTTKRADDAGHGVNNANDNSRNPGNEAYTISNPGDAADDRDVNEANGGLSFHFGFEQWVQDPTRNSDSYINYRAGTNAQLGIRTTVQHADLSSNTDIRNSYNFPGGGLGSLVSSDFSLAGADAKDRPTLYFNYFLETENDDGSSNNNDGTDPFRDSARVFASRDGGVTWELVATNNSELSAANTSGPFAELPGFLSHLSDAGLNAQAARAENHQIVQELFDNSGNWRQARVDMSTFAGEPNIQIRVDFSTAGAMDDSSLGGTDSTFGEFKNGTRSIRSQDNQYEGFYIDDIIVGFAERGEMVTGPAGNTDRGITNLDSGRTNDNNPTALPDILSGPYQLEIRRAGEYAFLRDATAAPVIIGTTFDTNDNHTLDVVSTATTAFEPADGSFMWTPTAIEIQGQAIPAIAISPWAPSTDQPFTGTQSLKSGSLSVRPLSVYQATPLELGGVGAGAGVIQFAYRTSSPNGDNGLRFLINGRPQALLPTGGDESGGNADTSFATGDAGYRVVSFPFTDPANTVFSWVFASSDGTPVNSATDAAFIDDIQVLQGGTGLLGDENRERAQGMFIVDSNVIRDSGTLGINVQPGTEQVSGGMPHPGSTIHFPQVDRLFPAVDSNRLVPGIVVQNNVIVGDSAIRFAGEANVNPTRPVPFGRFVNNTLVGDGSGGIGFDIADNSSPTLMNNIITDFGTGIRSTTAQPVVIRSNYFQDNGTNGPTGTDAIVQAAGTPLFVDAANDNYYLVGTSLALDSSLNQLEDRFDYVTFKTELGIAISTIDAPSLDVFGQLRINSSNNPGGGGSNVFVDRGAVDRSDLEQPFVVLLDPIDYANTLREDRDPNLTVVHLNNPIVDSFVFLLNDGAGPNAPFEGTGINPASVNPSTITVRRNNITLTEGVDFTLGYNALTGELRLTPFSNLWEPAGVYEITFDNNVIADNAGNALRDNQADGTTKFTIILPEVPLDFGDAKLAGSANVYGTLLANNAARHAIINNASPRLGSYVDSENDSALLTGGMDDAPATVVATSPSASAIFDIQTHATATGGTIIRIDSLANPPSAGDVVSIDIGRVAKQFELVPAGIAPGVGNIPVRFAATDTADLIAAKLIAKINAEMNAAGDSLVVQAVAGSPDTIEIFNRDDEDGVNVGVYNDGTTDFIVFLKPGVTGTTTNKDDILGFLNPQDPAGAQIPVSVTGTGYVSAWIDFDGNGVFHPTLEKVIDNVLVTDATNPTIFNVKTPAGTTDKRTWARFRISPEGGLQPTGLAVGGEVEDYEVQILNAPLPVPVDDPASPSTHYTINEDGTLDTNDAPDVIPSVLDNDVISPLVITPVTVLLGQNVSNGTLVLDSATGDFTYTPLPDFVGIDTFTYRLATQQSAIDSMLSSTLFATVTIEVQPVNDAPRAADQTIVMLEDTPRTVLESELLANATADASPSYPVVTPTAPWDESDQVLHVVSLHVGGTTIDSTTPVGDFPIATSRGQILSATFDTSDPANIFLVSFEYQANQDLNRDNLRLVGDPHILDEITYTISDDGKSDDPNVLTDGGADDEIGVFDAVNGRLTHTAKISFDVRPENDDPIANDDAIDKSSTRWLSYWAGLGQPVPVPTEDQSLTIPIDFLLSNDVNARASAADENANLNDGSLTIPDPGTVLTTALGGTVTFNNDGTFTYRAPDHYYGEDTFTYTAQDVGINEDINGLRSLTPLTDTAVVTIFVEPTNDNPIAFPRELLVDEVVELNSDGTPTGINRKVAFDAEFLLQMSGVNPVLPGNDDPTLIDPYNESNQALRVVAFTDADESIDVLTDLAGSGGTGTLTMTTPSGGVLSFNFTAGAFVDGYYEPAVDYNGLVPHEADPANPLEFFNYVVSDDGTVLLPPNVPYLPNLGEARSLPTRVSLSVSAFNDSPFIPDFDTSTTTVDGTNVSYNANSITFNEREQSDAPSLTFDLYAAAGVEIKPGPLTALDELASQSLVSIVVQPALDLGGNSLVPAGLMSSDPLLTATGDITISPVADAFGVAVYDIIVTDSGSNVAPNNAVSIRKLTISINPVNDQPVAQDQEFSVDEAIEDAGESTSDAAFKIHFDAASLMAGSLPGQFDLALGTPYNEDDQTFDVVRFIVPSPNPGDADVIVNDVSDPVGTAIVPVTTRNGGLLQFSFVNGIFTEGTYTPAVDYNEQAEFDVSPNFINEVFQFIIRDNDGAGTSVPGSTTIVDLPSKFSEPATVTLKVNQRNDNPFVPAFDNLPIHVAEIEPTDAPTITLDLFNNPASVILPGRVTALDELAQQGLTITLVPVSVPGNIVPGADSLMAATPVLQADGTLTITPTPEAFGVAVYDVVVTDTGGTSPANQQTIRRLTITIDPVNDAPVAADQVFAPVDESIERDEFGNLVSPFPTTVVTFDKDRLLQNAVEGQFASSLNPLFNESEQELDVVRFEMVGAGGASIVIDGATLTQAEQTITRVSSGGGTFAFTFKDQVFVSGSFTPSVDYNQRTPFSPTEQFKFVIQDRGNVTVPGANPARSEDLGTLRSAAVTATFQVLDKNDPPIFTMAGEVNHSAQVNVTEDQNGLGTPVVVSGFVSDVFAGPVTALDENSAVHGQSVIFESLVLVGTDHGIFSQTPTLSATTGDLTLFPNPHAYGTQVYLVTANDQAPEGAARLTKTITINVAPVNDTPVTYPRSFTEIEAVELDKFGDPLDPAVEIDFDAAGLINGDSTLSEIPATAGDFASSVPAPFNEIEQTLRVVQFLIEDPVTGGTITIDGSLFKGQTVTQLTVTGGELEFSFDANGFFTTGKYRPAVDYNRLTPFDPTDVLQYVVEDDGRTTVPGGPASPIFLTPERSLPSSMTFRLIENNDPPVFVMPSQITILEDQASDHAPISQDNFVTGIAPGPGTALDEVGQSVTFSLQLLSTDVGLFSATPTISPTGRLTLLPNPDAFGTQVYLVTASDNAPGGTAKISVQTLTVNVTPVNDVPRAADQTLDLVTEAVERDSDGNLLSPLPVASMTFDKTQLLRNAVEGVFDAAINPSFNESEQELRVVAFRVPGAPMLVDGSIDEPGLTGGNGTVTRTTLTNATLTFTFVNGEFVSGTYTPSVDYNRRSPFAANDQFEFMIEDRGAVTIPGSNPLVTQDTGSLRSAYANATITTIEQNDPPEFDFLPVVNVLERDDNGETVVPDWAKNIQAGPSTALDELQRESVQFTFVPGLSSVPQGLFRLPPKVANNGALSVFPAPDAVGTATIVIEATDLDPSTPGFVPASHFVTFTLNVQPVNDAPRLNLAVVNTAGVSNSDPDLAYSVSTDGTITYTLREDNTQPGGNASTAYFIPLVQGAVNPPNGFAALGLLDVFNVGPDNEASGAPGGSQVLQLASFPRSTQRGGTLTEVFQGGQRVGLNYVPPTNYNSAIGADDGFTYSVNDNSIVNGDPTAGETYSLSQGTLFEDPRAVVNRVRLRMSPVNDRPEFETASLSVESAEDAGVTLKNAFAFNISAGPRSTATDESAQTLAFDVQPIGFDANAFFTTVPTISPTGRLTYQSAPDVFGEFKFTVMLSDNGPTDTATRGDLFQSVPVTMTINVRPVNDAPVKVSNAPNLTYVVGEDGSVVIPFVGNAADQPGLLDFFRVGPDNETSTLVGGGQTIDVASPYPATSDGGGTITPVLNAANEVIGLRYTPTLNFAGTDKFTYTISDDGVTVALGAGGVATNDFKSVTNQVTIGVSGVNDPPQFNGADDVDSVEDQGPVVVPNWATGVQAGPDEATDELLGDGTNPAQNVSFVLNQISGSASLFAVPPTVTITGNTASLSYTTAADANGDATFEVTLQDNGDPTDASVGHNNESVTQTFTIRVAAVNDVPTFTAGAVVDVDEDSDPYSQVWATNISPGPADESGQSVRFEVTVPTASLGLFETLPTIDAGGVLQFKPAKDASGFADLQVRAIDSLDAVSAVANLRINIDEVNDKPIAVTDNLDADEDAVVVIDSIDLTSNDVDPDLASNPLESLTVVLPASSTTQRGARLTYNPVNGQITYDPTLAVELQRLKPGDVLIDTFLYSVKDASGIESDPVEVTVTVQGINDAPVLNPDTVIINANGPTRFRPQDNDTDVDGTIVATSIVITSQPKSGALSVEEDGTLVYTPFASFDGQDEFRYTVADNLGQQSKQATVIITTSRLPIVPDFDDVVATSKDTTIVNVGAAATPVEGQLDLTSLNIISGPANGTATANPDGTISYKANVGHLGPDSLQVTITDSAGRVSEPATIHFNVVAFRLQNPNPTRFNDVNASGTVTTLDALLIINRIGLAPNNTSSIPVTAADRGPAYYDVNGDDIISALDALQVINQLSLQGPQASSEGSDRQGSGEAIPQLSPLAQSAVSQSTTLHVSEPVHEIETPTKVVDTSMPSTEPKDFLDLIAESHETSEGEESEDRLGAVDEAFANLL